MNRKATIAACVLALVLGLIVLFLPKSRELSFLETEITEDRWNEITSTHIKNPFLSLSGITFDGYELQLDSDGGRYFYSIIQNSDTAYNPMIYIPKESRINIATLKPDLSYESVAENQSIKLLLYTSVDYRIVDLVATTLPIMNIDTKWHPNISDKDSQAAISLFDNSEFVNQRIIKSDTNIHLRGSTSYFQEKKSYKLNLTLPDGSNNRLRLLGMRKDDDWILNSLYGDFEKVRNILAAQMWKDCCSEHNEMQAPNSFEYRFVELFVDNSYVGLYLLGYKPDKKVVNLNSSEYIYKYKDWANAEILRSDDNFFRYFDYEKGDAPEEDVREELLSSIDVISSGSIDDIKNRYDIDNIIDIELHGMITQNVDYVKDNKVKNLYITMKNTPTRRVVLYTPWDFDLAFGSSWKDGLKNNTSTVSYGSPIDTVIESDQFPTGALRRLGDKSITEAEKKRYAELRRGAWSNEHIFSLIDNYESEIFDSGAYYRDEARWPKGNYLEDTKDLSVFKEYMKKRLEFVDAYYDYK